MIFRPKTVIQRFFPPKHTWSPKIKKKRSSPKLRLIFRPISQIQTFEGGCFPMGGLFSVFHNKLASKAQKTCDFAYFTSQWGGSSPPWLRYCLRIFRNTRASSRTHCIMCENPGGTCPPLPMPLKTS